MLLALASGMILLLQSTRDTARHAAKAALQQSALAVEGAINRQFLQVDGALASLPQLLTVSGGAQDSASPEVAARLLQGLNSQPFAFRDLVLLRPDGSPWATARPSARNRALPVGLGELRMATRPGAVAISGPIRNPVTGDWALFFSRPVTMPGVGRLAAVAEVPVPLIEELLAAGGQLHGLHVALEGRDGRLLASLPHDESRFGKLLGATPGTALEVTRATLYGDVFVTARLELSDALAGWARDRDRLLAASVIAVIFVVALAVALCIALLQHERAEAERARAQVMLDGALECMSDGFVIWDAEDRLVTCNQQYRDLYRISAPFIRSGARFEDVIREGALHGQYPQADNDIEAFVRETALWHRLNEDPIERLLPDGRWVLITERLTPNGGVVGIRTDITALKRAQVDLGAANERAQRAMLELQSHNAALIERDQALCTQNVRFDAALNNMSHGLLMAGPEQKLIVCNVRFQDMFALDPAAIPPGAAIDDVFRAVELGGCLDADASGDLLLRQRRLAEAGEAGTFVVAGRCGKAFAVAQRPMPDGGWVATYEDVTEERRAETQIRFMAHHDALTELPNRVLFHTCLDQGLRCLSAEGRSLALLYLDLDKFKDVNDTLGHPVGDALLKAASMRLRACVREGEVVARLGGDEFAVISTSSDPLSSGQRIIEVLSAPYNLAGRQVVVGVSIGIAVATSTDTDADTLLKNADMALYRAKAEGRGTCRIFEAELAAKVNSRLAIETDLRAALGNGQFHIVYQPIFNVTTDSISGFEALLRWTHPVQGSVRPSQFVPLAEELGLIDEIGAWVLQRACADAAMLPGEAKMAVNLSPVQLRNDGIVQTVADALAQSGLKPGRLELEITETALLQNSEKTVSLLHRLRGLGLRIALDDFGTGFSSLSYLRSFPFDKLKIDRSFVGEITKRPDCLAIVEAVAHLAEKLGTITTAEGVETMDQLQLVREAGCTEAQGYLFGASSPIEKIPLDLMSSSRLQHRQPCGGTNSLSGIMLRADKLSEYEADRRPAQKGESLPAETFPVLGQTAASV